MHADGTRIAEEAGGVSGCSIYWRPHGTTGNNGLVGPLILVVDDERALADALASFLEDEGYRVSVARDGLTGLELALRQTPTLILSDVQMPHLDGRALVNRLRAVGHTMPIVLMSAVFAKPDLPGVRFIAKPFDLDHLLEVLEQTLNDTQSTA